MLEAREAPFRRVSVILGGVDWLPDNVGGIELAVVFVAAVLLFAGEIEDLANRIARAFRDR